MLKINNLDEREQSIIYALPIYIAILIAGADGTIDNSEINRAISLSKNKNRLALADLEDYYIIVNKDYEDKLKYLLYHMPKTSKHRERYLIAKIEKTKIILNKLDKEFSSCLLDSLRNIAMSIANASGGVFNLGRISTEESRILALEFFTQYKKESGSPISK